LLERSLYISLIAAAVAVGLAPGRALADKAPRVGIVVTVQVNLNRSEVQHLSQAMGQALRQKLVVDVVAGSEAIRRLPTDGVSESCAADEACVKDTAQRLSADELLFLVAVRVGNRIQVDSTWVDPASGRNASRPKVVMVRLDEAEARFADAASLILPDAVVRPTQQLSDGGGEGGGEKVGTVLIRPTPRRMTLPAWISLGAGAAMAGTAVAFGVVARSDYNKLKDRCEPMGDCKTNPNYDSAKSTIDRNALTADILAGAALVAGATTLVLWWTSGGEIERIPVNSQALHLRVDPANRGTFLVWEGDL
jgi:hypothetical protein